MYLTDATPEPTSPAIIFEAIVRRQCLSARYNRADIIVAPHILYTKHDELYVDAVTVSRNLVMAKEPRLATFKLAGLGAARVTGRSFEISELFEPEAEKYVGVTLLAAEPDAQAAA